MSDRGYTYWASASAAATGVAAGDWSALRLKTIKQPSMRDITHKPETLRTAIARGHISCSAATIALMERQALPKGSPYETARAAALLGAKQTAHLIPHCHPVSIDALSVDFTHELIAGGGGQIHIRAAARSIGRTGIEMEALTAVSVAALVLYDLLKPVDQGMEIGGLRLEEKTGGKSGRRYFRLPPTCAVLVCSDSAAAGKRQDRSGRLVSAMLEAAGAKVCDYRILPDDGDAIQGCIRAWIEKDIAFIFTTGGTGLGPRDHTVDAVRALLERDADGITEAMRGHGQQRSPLAMMSRAVAGTVARSTIVTLPGSSDGARESLEALLPAIFHARKMLRGGGH